LEQIRSKEKRKRILDVSGKVRRNRIVRDVDGRKRLGEEKERITEGVQHAIREKKKGRAKGGIITGVRRGIEEIDGIDSVDNKGKSVNGVQERRLRIEGKIWRIVTVYNGEGMKKKRKELEKWVEEKREEILCIEGDFNARIGEEGKRCEKENDKEVRRSTRDKEINREGKELLVLIEDRGWEIVNGNIRGDKSGEWTYTGGRGESVVDYVIVNQEAWDKLKKMKVGKRTESDHQSLEVDSKGESYSPINVEQSLSSALKGETVRAALGPRIGPCVQARRGVLHVPDNGV